MKYFTDKLVGSMESEDVFLAVILIIVTLFFNWKKIVDFSEERKKAKINKFKDALNCNFISGLTKEHLQEALATEHFKMATGIRREKQFREALIKAHQTTNGNLPFYHFRRALPHIFFEENSLKVKIDRFEKFAYYYNLIVGFVFAILSLVLITQNFILLGQHVNFFKVITNFGINILFFMASLLILSQTLPVISARKVEKQLLKNSTDEISLS